LENRLIINSLAKLSHRHNEEPRNFHSKLSELIYGLNENFESYRIQPALSVAQAQGRYSKDNLTKYANDMVNSFLDILFLQIIRAASPERSNKHDN
jgi:hypothetical protein